MSGIAKFTMKVTKDFDGKGLDALKKRLEDAKGMSVRVGLPDSVMCKAEKVGKDGKKTLVETDFSLARLGRVHEYGLPEKGIPERPFLRPTIRENLGKYEKVAAKSLKGLINGSNRIDVALAAVGEVAAKDVSAAIATGNFKPLKPETIKRKGSSSPLVDSGQMRKSVTWELADESD